MQATWLVGVLLSTIALSATQAAELRLNEVLADPSSDWSGDGEVSARDDEWVEIVNPTGTTVDMTGYRLASADTTWRYEFGGSLAPFGASRVTGAESVEWERETGNPAFGLRLTNSGGTVHLWHVSASDTLWVDSVTYPDDAADDDRSWGRLATNPDEWVLFDGLNPYTDDPPPLPTGCDPTPGVPNDCIIPTLERTWSEIKSLYGEFDDPPTDG
jgi:hypothetical protein